VKHVFLDFTKIAISVFQEVENEFRRIGGYFKRRLIDFQKIPFWAGKKGRKSVCRDVEHPETSLSRRRSNHISFLQETENYIEEKGEPLI
jgi:hypothetical protein